jgi:hypothetical protein
VIYPDIQAKEIRNDPESKSAPKAGGFHYILHHYGTRFDLCLKRCKPKLF